MHKSRRRKSAAIVPYLYIAPTVGSALVFVIYPFLSNFSFSLFQWDGFGAKVFIGLKNFIDLASDERFIRAFQTNLVYFFFTVIVSILLGLAISSLIARGRLRGVRFFQSVYFIPQVVAAIALGTIFRWIYAPLFGVINHFLRIVGLEHLQRPWLGNPETATVAVAIIGTWAWLGFCIIVYVAGIQKIDENLYEASLLDGAKALQQFWYITLPDLRFEVVVTLIMATVHSLGSYIFAVTLVTTGGAYGTRPIALYAYQAAFVEGRVGYASAVVIVLTGIIFGVAGLSMFLLERKD